MDPLHVAVAVFCVSRCVAAVSQGQKAVTQAFLHCVGHIHAKNYSEAV